MLIFQAKQYRFPYHDLSFPGQNTEERILFVTREGRQVLSMRWGLIIASGLLSLVMRQVLLDMLADFFPSNTALVGTIGLVTFWIIIGFTLLGIWWTYVLWRKSVFIITTRRLTKFIHTTPWNRYQLSLGLDKIVDTGAYQKGLLQGLTGLGYFVARSSAGNIKNFKIVNISFAEDLHNYVNKVLYTFNKETEKLDVVRPFIPHLKGQARDDYVNRVAPKYGKGQTQS